MLKLEQASGTEDRTGRSEVQNKAGEEHEVVKCKPRGISSCFSFFLAKERERRRMNWLIVHFTCWAAHAKKMEISEQPAATSNCQGPRHSTPLAVESGERQDNDVMIDPKLQLKDPPLDAGDSEQMSKHTSQVKSYQTFTFLELEESCEFDSCILQGR